MSESNQADHVLVSQSFLQLLISKLFVACSQSQAQVRAGSERERVFIRCFASSKDCVLDLLKLWARVVIPPCLQVITLLHLYETPRAGLTHNCLSPLPPQAQQSLCNQWSDS